MPIYSDILENALKVLSRKSEESGKFLLPETRARIAEVASPLIEKASSPTKDINRGRLFNSLINSERPETANKDIVKAARRGMETVPDWYYESLKPKVSFSSNPIELASGVADRYRFGQYMHNPKQDQANILLNQYIDPSRNPNVIISHAYDTPPHELLHFGTYAGKDALKASPLKTSVDDVANVRGTSAMLRSAQKSLPRFDDWLKQKTGKTLYEITPEEGAANAFTDFLNAGHYDIAEAFKKSHSKAMDDFAKLLPDFAKKGMEWGDKYRGVILPVAATTAAGASAISPTEAFAVSPDSIAQQFFQGAVSNNDIAATQELVPSHKVAPDFSDKKVNPIGEGDKFAAAKAVGAVGKAVIDPIIETAKSVKKVITGDKDVSADDIANIIMWSDKGFIPATVYDVLKPEEVNAGEPDPAEMGKESEASADQIAREFFNV